MKKLICVLLLIAVTLCFAACASKVDTESTTPTMAASEPTTAVPDTVTMYIPEKMTVLSPNGTQVTVELLFEEGWETKESFTVTYSGDIASLGGTAPVITYSANVIVTEILGVSRIEAIYDDNGRQISQITNYTGENAALAKLETTITYDSYGRMLTKEMKNYLPGASEPNVQAQTYTYTDTDTGSKGTWSDGGITYVIEYDKDYRLVAQSTIVDGQEISRSETEYDANGNQINVISYAQGQKITETKTSYKAVEVSQETADRLPMFKRGN